MAELSSEQLWHVCQRKPSDFEPYGQRTRLTALDCSCGCKWFHTLSGPASKDWGVCGNPASPAPDSSRLNIRVAQNLSRSDPPEC